MTLKKLTQVAQDFVKIQPASLGRAAAYNQVIGGLHNLSAEIMNCEAEQIDRAQIIAALAEVYEVHHRSPFIRRCQEWPRAYIGDFETIEYLYHGQNQAPADTLEYYCEEYALQNPVAQQHRNKMHYQAELIMDCCKNPLEEKRILSIAAGSCLDIQQAMPFIPASAQLVLNDISSDALDAARAALQPIESSCTFLARNPITLAADRTLGQFDLILVGGLFDYLPDRAVSLMIRNIYNYLLKPGGTLFFSNIGAHNPYRAWLEYLANWRMIGRSDEDIHCLFDQAHLGEPAVMIEREETGLTALVSVQKFSADPLIMSINTTAFYEPIPA